MGKSQIKMDKVSDVYGQKVYTEEGVYLGVVSNIKLDLSGADAVGLVLQDANDELRQVIDNNNEKIIIPYKWVESVHNIVITTNIIERLDY
jgi:sporulation protein YlmC with PRC-barrel domain